MTLREKLLAAASVLRELGGEENYDLADACEDASRLTLPLSSEPTNVATIRREYLGGSEDVTLDEFASVVGDDDVAREVAESLLALRVGDGYLYNSDKEPGYTERLTVLDVDALRSQMVRL